MFEHVCMTNCKQIASKKMWLDDVKVPTCNYKLPVPKFMLKFPFNFLRTFVANK